MHFFRWPYAEQFFEGGITPYTIKRWLNNIDRDEARSVNCVSMNITESMALNVGQAFQTQWSIATTGYSTPVPESGNDIYAYYSIAYRGKKIIVSDRIDLEPHIRSLDAQHCFAEYVLSAFKCEVKKSLSKLEIKKD